MAGVHVALDDDLAAAGGVQGEAGGDVGLAALRRAPTCASAPHAAAARSSGSRSAGSVKRAGSSTA